MVTFYMDRVVLRVLFGFLTFVVNGVGPGWVFGWLRILVVLGFGILEWNGYVLYG